MLYSFLKSFPLNYRQTFSYFLCGRDLSGRPTMARFPRFYAFFLRHLHSLKVLILTKIEIRLLL